MKVQPALTDTELRLFLKESFQNCHQTNLALSPTETLSDLPPQARNWFGENPAKYIDMLAGTILYFTWVNINNGTHIWGHRGTTLKYLIMMNAKMYECLLRFSPCFPPSAGLCCGSLDSGSGQTRHIMRNTWSQSKSWSVTAFYHKPARLTGTKRLTSVVNFILISKLNLNISQFVKHLV